MCTFHCKYSGILIPDTRKLKTCNEKLTFLARLSRHDLENDCLKTEFLILLLYLPRQNEMGAKKLAASLMVTAKSL